MRTITVYSTPTCPYCKQEKDYLSSKDVEFESIDVSEDEEKAHEMVHLSGQMGVPVTVIKEEGAEPAVIVGFNKTKLDSVLKLS